MPRSEAVVGEGLPGGFETQSEGDLEEDEPSTHQARSRSGSFPFSRKTQMSRGGKADGWVKQCLDGMS